MHGGVIRVSCSRFFQPFPTVSARPRRPEFTRRNRMSRRTLLPLALSVCCALMLACAGADNANYSNTTPTTPTGATATTAPPPTPPPTTPTPATTTAAGAAIGVAECDDYL